jgi:hypothetical protein
MKGDGLAHRPEGGATVSLGTLSLVILIFGLVFTLIRAQHEIYSGILRSSGPVFFRIGQGVVLRKAVKSPSGVIPAGTKGRVTQEPALDLDDAKPDHRIGVTLDARDSGSVEISIVRADLDPL